MRTVLDDYSALLVAVIGFRFMAQHQRVLLYLTAMLLSTLALAHANEGGVWVCGAGSAEIDGLYTECEGDYTRFALNGTCMGLKGL